MTRDEAFTALTVEHGMQELTATNLLQTAFKGQSAWLGGSQSPYRLVHETGVTREDGYQILADGFVIQAEDAPAGFDMNYIASKLPWVADDTILPEF